MQKFNFVPRLCPRHSRDVFFCPFFVPRALLGTKTPIIEVENSGTNNAYYRIAFYNQTSAFFASTANFGQLAIIAGKPLKLKFCIQAINVLENKSDKVFFYTWYLGKEEVGQLTNNVPQ